MTIDTETLFAAAKDVQAKAHARYSNYCVGAAILDETDRVHVGCNVENASFPETSCAEANAIGAMVSSGARKIVAIAIVGGMGNQAKNALFESAGDLGACTPCGGCRQRILEFADESTQIMLIGNDGKMQTFSIDELLPAAFRVE
jgi:cytidine deaminase